MQTAEAVQAKRKRKQRSHKYSSPTVQPEESGSKRCSTHDPPLGSTTSECHFMCFIEMLRFKMASLARLILSMVWHYTCQLQLPSAKQVLKYRDFAYSCWRRRTAQTRNSGTRTSFRKRRPMTSTARSPLRSQLQTLTLKSRCDIYTLLNEFYFTDS